MSSQFTVYVLVNPSGRFYIGQTGNLTDRLLRHNGDREKSTRRRGPWHLVYSKTYHTRSEAVQQEKYLKQGSGFRRLQSMILSGRGVAQR